jgi:hypothetical protein
MKNNQLRKGQFMFNFLEWLRLSKGYLINQSERMADPFHIPDDEWDKLMEEYEKINGLKENEI